MDEAHLKRILEQGNDKAAPENVKKRALNLAMAEFDSRQKEKSENNQKNFQGNGFFSRLMGVPNKNDRRKPMKKSTFIFGGTATAMAVILAVGLSLQSPQTMRDMSANEFRSVSGQTAALQAVEFKADKAKPMDAAMETARSALPVPITPPRGGITEQEARRVAAPMAKRAQIQTFAAEADMAVAGSAPAIGIINPPDIMPPPHYQDVGRDKFEDFTQNPFMVVADNPVSTFSVDVDTASYSFMRRQLEHGVMPQKDAVRVEEMINYFDYNYPMPETRDVPFKATATVTPSPWAEGRKLLHIGIKGYDIEPTEKPRSNLVFLLDVSGSMNAPDKLPLLKNSMKMLLDTLEPEDTVAIAVYAGASGTVLEPTKVSEKRKIMTALDNLRAGGGTAGAAGLKLAYQLAEQNFDKDAVNRVILATDGDFNVGITSQDELQDFIERKRDSGVFLSVLGFGQGNLNDSLMQKLAQNGNGTAAYIDSLNEARKVLVEEASSTLFPIAKDVKIQIEFNPATVAEYRLIGYETRHLNREDFNNDAVDAGDIGAGHTVTAIYEITPVGGPRTIDDSRYASKESADKVENEEKSEFSNEYAFLKLRYKLPKEDKSHLVTTPVTTANELHSIYDICGSDELCDFSENDNVQFSVAVAAFGQILKGGKYTDGFTYDDVIKLAQEGKGKDEFGYRSEFIQLVRLAKSADAMDKPQ